MIDPKKYIGLELAIKLYKNRCGVITDHYWVKRKDGKWYLMESKEAFKTSQIGIFPTYEYFDILVTHAEEFFGKIPKKLSDRKYFFDVIGGIWSNLMVDNFKNADYQIWYYSRFNPENKKGGE